MKSGLEDRNNAQSLVEFTAKEWVSMKSGLEDRNNSSDNSDEIEFDVCLLYTSDAADE